MNIRDCYRVSTRMLKAITAMSIFFFSGNEINYVGIVLTGSVEIIKENLAGSRHILDFLGPSNIFGEGIVLHKKKNILRYRKG